MIPADVASRLQVSADTALRSVAPAQEIADKLSGLVAGQKVMAEIQAMLPNGTYRALINQRNVTLALPFAAKSGDSLELQVTESDGKLALAVVAGQNAEGQLVAASASATLSKTGQLISTLFSAGRDAGGPAALPLNENQPLAAAPPNDAQDLLPMLKQAITQSGMFYEAHQAEWLEGRFTQAALLQEPQGKLSSPAAFATAAPADEHAGAAPAHAPAATATAAEPPSAARQATDVAPAPSGGGDAGRTSAAPTAAHAPGQTPEQLIAPQTQAIVQQQLDALATQNFSWQGQVWPGQEMRWEIDEDATRNAQAGDEAAAGWTTRLDLTLPNLGQINAQIRLQGEQISVTMTADNVETRALLRASGLVLRAQLDAAGLTLAALGVAAATEDTPRGDAGE
jgi:hypothetical protein